MDPKEAVHPSRQLIADQLVLPFSFSPLVTETLCTAIIVREEGVPIDIRQLEYKEIPIGAVCRRVFSQAGSMAQEYACQPKQHDDKDMFLYGKRGSENFIGFRTWTCEE